MPVAFAFDIAWSLTSCYPIGDVFITLDPIPVLGIGTFLYLSDASSGECIVAVRFLLDHPVHYLRIDYVVVFRKLVAGFFVQKVFKPFA